MATKGAGRTTRQGSERVKAWIYSAINPLLESLRAETVLLSKKSVTWRYSAGDLEFVVSTRDLISPSGRPNYDDLLRGYPGLRPQMDARDKKVGALAQAAHDCWKYLTHHSSIRQTVEQHLKQWREEGNPYPGGAIPEEEFWLLIAELVMNSAADLPFHYTTRPFWFRFQQNFLTFRTGHQFFQLEKSITELKRSDAALIDALDQARSELCEEYDVPAAPI